MENSGAQQPGQTVSPTPASAPGPTPPPVPSTETPRASAPAAGPAAAPSSPPPAETSTPAPPSQPPEPPPPAADSTPPGGFYRADAADGDGGLTAARNRPALQDVSWTASEFIAHEKSIGWYAALALVAGVLAALSFLITRDWVSVGVVVVAAIMLGIYGARKPRQLQYQIDSTGLSIGQKRYDYREFRSFAIMSEGAFSSIVFMPLKRFAPPTSIYYAPDDEERIVDLLADQLPFEEHNPDPIDRLMSRIRF